MQSITETTTAVKKQENHVTAAYKNVIFDNNQKNVTWVTASTDSIFCDNQNENFKVLRCDNN